MKENAHNDQITDIEYTNLNGQHIFITCSLDMTLKAWSIAPDNKTIQELITQPLQVKPLSLKFVKSDFLIIGLESGTFQGWFLNNNTFQ